MRLQVSRVDHHRLRDGSLSGQAIHHPGEDPPVAPPLPSIVEGLRRAVFFRRIAPPQPIAIDKDYAAQHPPVIDARLTVALGKEGLQTGHLRVGQPEKVAHDPVFLRSLNQAASARSTGPDPRGTSVYGRVFTAWAAAGLLGPSAAGMLFDRYQNYQFALVLAALAATISLALILTNAYGESEAAYRDTRQ